MRKYYFRVDGGNVYSLGMGHVYRCLKIADCLKRKGIGSVFIMRGIRGGIDKVRDQNYPVISLPGNLGPDEEINKLADICKGSVLIADIRGISNKFFRRLNAVCKKTIYFDDLGSNNFSPDVLINPAVTPQLRRYRRKQKKTRYLLGVKYFILGQGFRRKHKVSQSIKNVAVSLGGADPAGYTPRILKILSELKYSFRIKLILGPAFRNFNEISGLVKALNGRISVLKNVKNMGKWLYQADLAFVSGGDTALELAYTGTPGIIVPTIDYENITAEYLEGKSIFINLRDIKKIAVSSTLKKIEAFWEDYNKRKRFSRNARSFIDGRWINRISPFLF